MEKFALITEKITFNQMTSERNPKGGFMNKYKKKKEKEERNKKWKKRSP